MALIRGGLLGVFRMKYTAFEFVQIYIIADVYRYIITYLYTNVILSEKVLLLFKFLEVGTRLHKRQDLCILVFFMHNMKLTFFVQ